MFFGRESRVEKKQHMLDVGLWQVYTGNGKGKTTAAVGQAIRAHGAGLRVYFIQFVKGGDESHELAVLRTVGIEVLRLAKTTTGLLHHGVTDEDRRVARATWESVEDAMTSRLWDVLVLDELHAALKYELLDVNRVVQSLDNRPVEMEIITTGRNAPDAVIAKADLVTVMEERKHPIKEGIPARKGIEY